AIIVTFIGDHQTAGLLNRGEEASLIQRLQGSRIHHLRRDSFFPQHFCGGQRARYLDAGGDDRNVATFALDGRVTEGHFIVAVGRNPPMAAPAAIPQKPTSSTSGSLIRLEYFTRTRASCAWPDPVPTRPPPMSTTRRSCPMISSRAVTRDSPNIISSGIAQLPPPA